MSWKKRLAEVDMIRFESDYTEGAAPEIMRRLAETNMEQTAGYGEDEYSMAAREKIRAACGAPEGDVHFLMGGTQTNLTVTAAALRPHQGVIAADSGHIAVHESGAIEAAGHKVLTLASPDGKVSAAEAEEYCRRHYADENREHCVQPGMIYISQPTESGGLYSLEELRALRRVCDEFGLLLYADGARLGYALAAEQNDVGLKELYGLADAFYIGGTKVGALFGEALVIRNEPLKKDFKYILKQRGGLLAKGRLLGLQFDTLFSDGLYYRLSRHAVEQAMRIKDAFRGAGFEFLRESYTNQQFPILENRQAERLGEEFVYSPWGRVDERRAAVRFCTSWATREEDVDRLAEAVRGLQPGCAGQLRKA